MRYPATVLYICGDSRSGSTVLDQMLGSHSEISSLGEVAHLHAYATLDRSEYNPSHELVCSCGAPLNSANPTNRCAFWASLEQKIGSLEELKTNLKLLHPFKWRLVARYPKLFPILWRFGEKNWKIYDSIGGVVIDSSKDPIRLLSLFAARPRSVRTVFLTRDYRAVALSKMNRGTTLESSVLGWVHRLELMAKTERLLPSNSSIRVKYEELMNDPASVIGRISRLVDLDFQQATLSRSQATHHIGGSPSKFESRPIQMDTRYLNAFSAEQLHLMQTMAGQIASQWGYGQ